MICKGTLRQVFICLRPPPLLGFCLGWSSNFVGSDSESGQKQSVKLLQNMVSNRTNTTPYPPPPPSHTLGGFIKGILRGVRCTKSLRVLFLHRRPPSWTTLVLYSRAVFIFNEPAYCLGGEPERRVEERSQTPGSKIPTWLTVSSVNDSIKHQYRRNLALVSL